MTENFRIVLVHQSDETGYTKYTLIFNCSNRDIAKFLLGEVEKIKSEGEDLFEENVFDFTEAWKKKIDADSVSDFDIMSFSFCEGGVDLFCSEVYQGEKGIREFFENIKLDFDYDEEIVDICSVALVDTSDTLNVIGALKELDTKFDEMSKMNF